MNETAQLTAPVPLAAPPASENGERGRTHGLPFIFWVLEQNIWALLSVPTVVALLVGALTHLHWPSMVAAWLAQSAAPHDVQKRSSKGCMGRAGSGLMAVPSSIQCKPPNPR